MQHWVHMVGRGGLEPPSFLKSRVYSPLPSPFGYRPILPIFPGCLRLEPLPSVTLTYAMLWAVSLVHSPLALEPWIYPTLWCLFRLIQPQKAYVSGSPELHWSTCLCSNLNKRDVYRRFVLYNFKGACLWPHAALAGYVAGQVRFELTRVCHACQFSRLLPSPLGYCPIFLSRLVAERRGEQLVACGTTICNSPAFQPVLPRSLID